MDRRLVMAVAMLALFALACGGSQAVQAGTNTPTPATAVPQTDIEADWLSYQMSNSHFTGGGLVEGRRGGHIKPGLYIASTPSTCFWDAKGLATGDRRGGHGFLTKGKDRENPVYAEIYSTDYSFASRGCGIWTRVW